MATGILPIVVGEGTKFISFIEKSKKSYDVKSKLGVFSECGDFENEPVIFSEEKKTIANLKEDIINQTLQSFIGNYMQTPPMYSNTKYKGKPLHNYARRNIQIERKQKKRIIYDLKFNYLEKDIFCFSVVCSSGTYIRTLVQDISDKWNVHSCLYDLHRSQVQPFYNHPIISLESYNHDRLSKYLITIPDMLCDLSEIILTENEVNKLYTGLSVNVEKIYLKHTFCKILDKNNKFHGVGIIVNNCLSPKRLMKLS